MLHIPRLDVLNVSAPQSRHWHFSWLCGTLRLIMESYFSLLCRLTTLPEVVEAAVSTSEIVHHADPPSEAAKSAACPPLI